MIGLAALAMIVAMDVAPMFDIEFPEPGTIEVRLDGRKIFSGSITGETNTPGWISGHAVSLIEGAEPMILGYPHGPKTADWVPQDLNKASFSIKLDPGQRIDVKVSASADSIPCSDSTSIPLTSTFGGATSSLDNGVYDRTADWILTADGPTAHVRRVDGHYCLSAEGPATIALKKDYYRNHLGYFRWDRRRPLWRKPVAGWCSWAAYGQDITEPEVLKAAEFFSKDLRAYGYDVIQIDDGYQRVMQITDNHQPITEPFADYWTKPNDKFPSGMKSLAERISGLGMTPGIWVGLYLPIGLRHADSYVTDPDGKPLQGPWVGYSMDSGNKAAVEEAYTDALKAFRADGWRYFKIDTLRHVLYDSYRRAPEYWAARHTDSSAAFRHLFAQVREAVGKDNYLLACWGALPELAGLPDGCRIGEDVGPSFASMRKSAKYIAQFHYANNVVWRNDPDYMCLRVSPEQCQTWATLTSLTGGHVMVSDPVEAYDAARVDILRRVGPPLVTKPGNVIPHDPDPEWVTLNAAKSGDSWTVAARMAWKPLPAKAVSLDTLGLNSSVEYLAFDFWHSRFLGVVRGTAPFIELPEGACQVVAFRPVTGLPQVLGDDRHVGQGALELDGVKFEGHRLSGRFLRSPGRTWKLFLYEPKAWGFERASVDARQIEPRVVELTIPEGKGWLGWQADFANLPGK